MRTHTRLNIPPDGRPPLLAALQAKREEVRRTLSDPSADARASQRARAAALRVAILERVASKPGAPLSRIAGGVGCSVHAVRRAIRDFNDRGLDAAGPRPAGRKRDPLAEKQVVQDLKLLVEQMPDAGPQELAGHLGLSLSRFHHYRRLANVNLRRARPGRPSPANCATSPTG